jgi:hypothetical protein
LLLMILYHRLIKQLDTFNKFVDTYYVNINCVECYGIINALSNNRNQFIMGEIIKLDRICLDTPKLYPLQGIEV